MKTLLKHILVATFLFQCFATANAQRNSAIIPPKPSPQRLVNDDPALDLLTADQEQVLEKKLVAFDDSTSNQICVLVVSDIGDYDITDFATEVGRAWGVGGKEYNNGVMVVVLIDKERGRRQIAIAPGYGLEGKISDYLAKEIIETQIIPNFKSKDIYRGLDEGTDAIIQAIGDVYKASSGRKRRGDDVPPKIFIAVVVFIIIMIVLSNINRKGGGGMVSRRGYRRWNDTPPVFWFPTGGGRSSWGGGGGGGFGGFGGGSFGGGGASGSW
ncbi:MAG: TPM domain-containing protein, partial [Bacteroidetes bacterium]|nr:TPM domain-containing protein [Bacteroidota bacterium]